VPSGGGGEIKLFLIIVNVLEHPKGVGGLTSNFLRGGGMDVFWNYPFTIASLQNTLESTEMTNKCLRKEITQINSNNLLKANRNVSTQCRLDRPELINHRSNRGNRSTQQYSSHTDRS
jgi:hypothetical protein